MIMYDEAMAAKLREFSEKAGPSKGPLSEEHLVFRIEILQDPHWLDFLSLSAEEAQAALNNHRKMLYQIRHGAEYRK